MSRIEQSTSALIAVALAALAGAVLILAPAGLLGSAEAAPKDAALVVSSVLHSALGIPIALVPWLATAGLASIFLDKERYSLEALLLISFPFSLPLSAVFSVLALVVPWGVVLAGAGLIACAAPVTGRCIDALKRSDMTRTLAALMAIAIVYGAWIGLIKHGPTATMAAYPHGDFSLYTGTLWSIYEHGFPIRDLTIEGETHFGVNLLLPLIGAAVLKALPIDSFLFLASGGSAFFLLTAALSLHLYLKEVPQILAPGQPRLLNAGILALAILTSGFWPTWHIDTIPMIYAVGTTISAYYLIRRSADQVSMLPAAMLASAVGPAFSKVVVSGALMPVAAVAALRSLNKLPAGARVVLIALGGVALVYCGLMLAKFGPMMLAVHQPQPLTLTYAACCHVLFVGGALRDLSTLNLIAVAFVVAGPLTGLALAVPLLLGFFYPAVFFASIAGAAIVLALIVVEANPRSCLVRVATFVALELASYKSVYEDASGIGGLVLVLGVGVAVVLVLHAAARQQASADGSHVRAGDMIGGFALPVVLLGSLGLVAVVSGGVRVESGFWKPHASYPALAPADFDIWRNVRGLTPRDALIFTDSVTKSHNLVNSWNTYAAHGGRQIFISQWIQSKDPRPDGPFIRPKLEANTAVLDGRKAPSELQLSRRYGSYYAVVSAGRAMAPSWRHVYRNQSYALYEWRPG